MPETHYVPLHDVEHVVLTTSVSLTIPLIAELMRRNIPVIVTAGGERVLGSFMPPAPHSRARLAQYQMTLDSHFSLAISSVLVEAKIRNQRRVIQRLSTGARDDEFEAVILALETLAEQCRKAENIDMLRGYEGTAAGQYFKAFGRFFPAHAPFERRSRRPPHNAVNAVLSFAYTIMVAEMECCIQIAGLDPALGFFHETQDRRPSLALDLVEPFRPVIADSLTLDLFSHRTLRPEDHFEQREGGIYMNSEGKKRFFVAWERRMTREFLNAETGIRTTLRNEFQRAANALKLAITEGKEYQPFLMQ